MAMAMAMREARFILNCLASFLLMGVGYFLLIDRLAIADAPLGRSYRQFLLTATDDVPNRIIVDSGSNAIHSIDAQKLEAHFGRPTLILSDNAGYPLHHKIERLANHLKAGDTLILPLEWLHYRADDRLPADYVQSILDESGSNAFYYRELPWQERALFVYRSIPINLGLQSILRLNGVEAWNLQISATTQDSLVRFEQEIRHGSRGNQMIDEALPIHPLTRDLTCDHYLFGLFEFPGISQTFQDNLQRLSTLRQIDGVNIFFAWPAVAARDGDECYQLLRPAIEKYVEDIRRTAEAQGFSFLGEPGQSRFDSRCLLDTYYHIRARCADVRTQTLILQLERQGLKRASLDQPALQERLLVKLQQLSPAPDKPGDGLPSSDAQANTQKPPPP
ncbi:hypothetical protein SAMN05878276_2456 [Aquipseudomonas alcaligenes]|nr:hypothetical protein SAMN05878276_2456 [Pseudomonas alcaligenes]